MEKETKNYEIGFLTVNEDDAKEVSRELEAHKSEILNAGKPKRVNLAYGIKKQTVAYFTYIQFAMDPSLVESLSSKLKLNQKILRFMVINLPAIAIKAQREAERPIEQSESPVSKSKAKQLPAESPRKASSDDFINNELLEKKLEEILK